MNSLNLQYRGQGNYNYNNNYYYANEDRGGRGGPPPSIVYQIDFNAIAAGKMIAMTKRHIKWRFGFPNQEAIDSGKQGIDCRGEEHDVTLIWSVVSGKRMLMSNGRQLLVDVNKGKMFEHTWINQRGNTLKMVVYSSQPMSSHMGNRQYDLFIDGVSFFVLPKLYEVGLRGSGFDNRIPGQVVPRTFPSETNLAGPQSEQQEKEDLKRAIQESLEESRRHLMLKGKLQDSETSVPSKNEADSIRSVQETVQQVDLLDLFSEPAPTAQSQALVHVPTQNSSQYQLDPFAQNAFQGQPSLGSSSFPTSDPFATFGYQHVPSQYENMNYATTPQTNDAMSSQHYATSAPQYYSNPFDTFGETGFAAPVADPNVTKFNTVGYCVQAASQHSNDYVQHTQHQMQYSATTNKESLPNQTMNFQAQNHQQYSQSSQPYQQQYPQQYYHNQSQYQ